MREVNKLIIHYSESDSKKYDFEAIKKDHIENKGFKDIGYHFVIDWNGMVHFGRDVEEIGAHCKGQNKDSIGICLLGRNKFTEAQFETLAMLIDEIRDWYEDYIPVFGHYEFSEKKCPNFNVDKFCKKYKL